MVTNSRNAGDKSFIHRHYGDSSKPTYRKIGKSSLQKIKFHSRSCEDVSKQELVFNKLDPINPKEAHKIEQRRKAIGKGKNTIGYDIYSRTVKKEKRHKRSMITPTTPDHTLDIPNKRWNGMVKSWRKALHRYDPVDLRKSFEEAQAELAPSVANEDRDTTPMEDCVKEKELTDSGVLSLVEVTSGEDHRKKFLSQKQSPSKNVSLELNVCTSSNGNYDAIDQWVEDGEGDFEDASFYSGDYDSDDELL